MQAKILFVHVSKQPASNLSETTFTSGFSDRYIYTYIYVNPYSMLVMIAGGSLIYMILASLGSFSLNFSLYLLFPVKPIDTLI